MLLEGYIVALVTPFTDDGKVDFAAFEKYVNYIANVPGIAGIVVAGSTGESLSLSDDEKISLIKCAQNTAGGATKIIGGIIDSVTAHGVTLMKSTEEHVDAFLCISPYYVKPSQEQLCQHFKTYNDSTSKDIILYNNPGRTAVDIKLDTFKRLIELERVVAIKECSSDLTRFTSWSQFIPQEKIFRFYSGNDETAAAAFAMGADGVVSVTANILPEQYARFYKSWKEHDEKTFFEYRKQLLEISELMFAEPSPAPTKYVLWRKGLMKNVLRRPLSPISDDLAKKIDSAINV